MYEERKSHVELLHEQYGWPLKIQARGYTAYLGGKQPLLDGKAVPIYRFPGGASVVLDDEWKCQKAQK